MEAEVHFDSVALPVGERDWLGEALKLTDTVALAERAGLPLAGAEAVVETEKLRVGVKLRVPLALPVRLQEAEAQEEGEGEGEGRAEPLGRPLSEGD